MKWMINNYNHAGRFQVQSVMFNIRNLWISTQNYSTWKITLNHSRHWNSQQTTKIRGFSEFVIFVHRVSVSITHTHARMHACTQPFYDPFSGTTWMSQWQKKSSSGLYGAREDIRGRHTNNPAGCHSIRTNQWPTSLIPPFLHRIPFLPQPSQFILAWNRHQIWWLAYPVAWLRAIPFYLWASWCCWCWRW